MDLSEFEEAVKKGEITDFEPYMHKQEFDLHRMILAKNGIEVDRIIKRDGNNVIVSLIKKGLETERYENWKNHPDMRIRHALAQAGYYPDIYINDKSPEIRSVIISKDIQQGLKRMHNRNDRYSIRWDLIREPNPDLDVLTAFLETVTKYELTNSVAKNEIKALRLKHQALIANPSPIEKTMAPYQLFETNNPLWTLSRTAIDVEQTIDAYDKLEPEYKQMNGCIKLMFEIKEQLINTHAPNIRAELRRQLNERN